MAVTDEKDGALATAAVAAAAGVAAYGLRKALSSSGNGSSARNRNDDDEYEDDENDDDNDEDGGDGISARAGSLLETVKKSTSRSKGGGSLLQTFWDSASGSLMPLAEEAADAAGTWVAENAPDLVRDQLVPRFIESFQDAA